VVAERENMSRGRLHLQKFSYRFAEQVLNSKLAIKEEIEGILTEEIPDLGQLSRPGFNKLLDELSSPRGGPDNQLCLRTQMLLAQKWIS
jgi:hypothetical protein